MATNQASPEQHIIAYRHCHPTNARILCFQVPEVCPLCQTDLHSVRQAWPPVRYPSVFVSARVSPCSIVIRPTVGTFLNEYKEGANLHAGITNTKGDVYAYDESGVQVARASQSWKQCVAVAMLDQYDDDIMEVWDKGLQTEAMKQDWQKERYQEDGHNCFDFAVTFLNHIQYNQTKWNKAGNITREELCHNYIVPLTARASKYISIYRHVQKKGFLINDRIY